MKLLIIHALPSVKSKWIEPLRNQGWGVMCVSSTGEADQVLQFHGRSLNAIVLHRENSGSSPEAAIAWFEQLRGKKEYSSIPSVIVSGVWGEREFLKHQNSTHSANIYLKDSSTIEELKTKIESFCSGSNQMAVGQNAGHTQQIATKSFSEVSLEDVSGILAKPELTRTNTQIPRTSVTLAAPSIMLGGKSSAQFTEIQNTVLITPEVEAIEGISFEVSEPIQFSEPVIEEPVVEEPVIVEPVLMSIAPISITPLPVTGVSMGDVDTLKNYLSMREQDVAVLTGQVRSAQERIHQLEVQLKVERARGAELQHSLQKQEQTLKEYDLNKKVELEVYVKQIEDLNVQVQEKADKIRTTETKLKYSLEEVGKIKDRVRVDLRRIRVREKDLEGQLEILKKDSSALLMARDEKITELKRKLDLLEFNMELVQEQYSNERSSSEQLRQRLKDASVVMKQAGGLLDHDN